MGVNYIRQTFHRFNWICTFRICDNTNFRLGRLKSQALKERVTYYVSFIRNFQLISRIQIIFWYVPTYESSPIFFLQKIPFVENKLICNLIWFTLRFKIAFADTLLSRWIDVLQRWDNIMKNIEKTIYWSCRYWNWYWNRQFQNIYIDIAIEICLS